MKHLIIVFLFLFSKVNGQVDFIVSKEFNYVSWSVKLDSKEKLKKVTDSKIGMLEVIKELGYSIEDELDNFYFGYFNKDKKLDLIYSGYIGSEGKYTDIYLGNEKGYTSIVRVGVIEEIIYDSIWDIPEIKAINYPCCADIIYTKTILKPNSNKSYQIVKTSYYDEGTLFPEGITMNQPFSIINAKYHLRRTPEIDTISVDEHGSIGNISNTYSTGDRGVAYASKVDSTGRVWWFVEILNSDPKDGKDFPEEGTYYLGWISSRYVKKE